MRTPAAAASPVLAIDLGGSKTAAALVAGGNVLDGLRIETAREKGPQAWLADMLAAVEPWRGRYAAAGIAVTGRIEHGRWSALNPGVLPVPDDFPLVEVLSRALTVPVFAGNDAQAAAWGEYRRGAGRGADMVFLTVSTGLGGGIVLNGRLLAGRGGLAGHIGQMLVPKHDGEQRLEDVASGSALARLAREAGRPDDPAALFAAAAAGDAAADALIDRAARPLARAAKSLQMALDPDCFVIGGGLGLAAGSGLAAGFIDRLRGMVLDLPASRRPEFRAAALGAEAGLIGIADLASTNISAAEVDP